MKITLFTGKTFEIREALGFDIKIVKSSRARRMTLRIDSKERLPVLTIPERCAAKRAVDFVNLHRGWIERSLARLPQTKNFEDGEQISLFGQPVVIRRTNDRRCGTFLENGFLNVSGDAEFLHRRVKDYIKAQAKTEFYRRSKILADRLGCPLNDVTIKDTKSRWGSCSSMHNINYSWRIALAPETVIDYLIAHEVAHLRHQDHSRAFWRCVRELYPEAEAGKVWLRLHSRELYRYE